MWEECECECVSVWLRVRARLSAFLFFFFLFPSALSPSFLVLIWSRVFPCCHLPAILCASFVPVLSPFSLPGTHTAYIYYGVQVVHAACTQSTSYLFFFFQLKLQLAYKTPNHVHRQKGGANQIHAARLPLALVIPNSPFLLLFAFFSFFPFAFFGFSSSFYSFSSASYLFYLFTSLRSLSLPRLPQL